MLSSRSHGRGWRAATALVISVLLPGTVAGAQVARDTTRRDSTAQQIERVVITAARTPAAVGGAAAVVVAPSALNVSAAPSLHEVLRQVPFILVRQNSRGEMEISMRGSESRQVATILDGLPLALGWDHRTDPSLIPAFQASGDWDAEHGLPMSQCKIHDPNLKIVRPPKPEGS